MPLRPSRVCPLRHAWYTALRLADPSALTTRRRPCHPSSSRCRPGRTIATSPILASLGHTFEVQAPLATAQGTKKPNYVFYRDSAALNANKGAVLGEARPAEHRGRHDQLTAAIVGLETDLSRRVYTLFDLSAAEIKLIEASTKYQYGEV